MVDVAGKYDVAVIGAGHAGIEAALASARLWAKTLSHRDVMIGVWLSSHSPSYSPVTAIGIGSSFPVLSGSFDSVSPDVFDSSGTVTFALSVVFVSSAEVCAVVVSIAVYFFWQPARRPTAIKRYNPYFLILFFSKSCFIRRYPPERRRRSGSAFSGSFRFLYPTADLPRNPFIFPYEFLKTAHSTRALHACVL